MNIVRIATMRDKYFKEKDGGDKGKKMHWEPNACETFNMYVGFSLHVQIETEVQEGH